MIERTYMGVEPPSDVKAPEQMPALVLVKDHHVERREEGELTVLRARYTKLMREKMEAERIIYSDIDSFYLMRSRWDEHNPRSIREYKQEVARLEEIVPSLVAEADKKSKRKELEKKGYKKQQAEKLVKKLTTEFETLSDEPGSPKTLAEAKKALYEVDSEDTEALEAAAEVVARFEKAGETDDVIPPPPRETELVKRKLPKLGRVLRGVGLGLTLVACIFGVVTASPMLILVSVSLMGLNSIGGYK